jgi:hypothetical protein
MCDWDIFWALTDMLGFDRHHVRGHQQFWRWWCLRGARAEPCLPRQLDLPKHFEQLVPHWRRSTGSQEPIKPTVPGPAHLDASEQWQWLGGRDRLLERRYASCIVHLAAGARNVLTLCKASGAFPFKLPGSTTDHSTSTVASTEASKSHWYPTRLEIHTRLPQLTLHRRAVHGLSSITHFIRRRTLQMGTTLCSSPCQRLQSRNL